MKYLVIGGAGFIGSYIVDHLLSNTKTAEVTVYDNFSSGKLWHLKDHQNDKRLHIFENDIYDDEIFKACKDKDVVFLLAANPDISKAVEEPDIDFKQGTVLTQIVLEGMRKAGTKNLIYSSGSGVYGDIGDKVVYEDYGPMEPISTYGASKLACEALISSYCHMFDFRACVFRFGNVIGGRQTHGVAYDFIKRLKSNSSELSILGDGSQSKPYIHVSDVIKALDIAFYKQSKIFDVYNVAPDSYITVTEIANIVIQQMGGNYQKCNFNYSGGKRGWKGDVPVVRMNSDKIKSLGWLPSYTSKEAINFSVGELIKNAEFLFA